MQNLGWYKEMRIFVIKNTFLSNTLAVTTFTTGDSFWRVCARLVALCSQYALFLMESPMSSNDQSWSISSESAKAGHSLHSSRRWIFSSTNSLHQTTKPPAWPLRRNMKVSSTNLPLRSLDSLALSNLREDLQE